MSHSPGTYVPSTLICSLLCMSLSTQRCGCCRRACDLAVRISPAGTRSMQQWCLKSCVLPQNPPGIPKLAPAPVPCRPLPAPPSDQVTLTVYSMHLRTSLLRSGSRTKAAMPHPAVQFIAPAACVSVRPPTGEAAIWVMPPCSDPRLGRDVRIFSSSTSVHLASLAHRALFHMARNRLAKTKYGARPKPKAMAQPPSPPSRAPEAPHTAPVPAMAPADRGTLPSAPGMRAVEPRQSRPSTGHGAG